MLGNQSEPLPVVRAKLHAPRVPPDLVRRGRLYDLLSQNPDRPFTLVSAPAGYGKSTLVANWLNSVDVAGTWFSIEESDNDVRQFLTYLIAAGRNHSKNACSKTLGVLRSPEMPSLATLRESLANDLDAIRKPFILVLDDYHLVDRPEIHETVDYLLDFPPRALHLVIITRCDPPLQLSKFRAGGRMTDVRERDLRFTMEETRAVVQRLAGIKISDEVLGHIHAELEGWIVGLRLVCLALQDRDDPEKFLRGLSGGTPAMLDYLAGEVLSRQPEVFRQGLLSLSVLDRFCAPLCDALCGYEGGGDSGGRFLSELNKANLFIIELNHQGKWFRFHHLFQRLLLNQLESQARPGDIEDLHLRASRWFESQGMVEDSLKHAMAAGDADRAACLLEKFREGGLKNDGWYDLEKWLMVLPEESLQKHPELLLIRAWMHVHHFQYPRVIQVVDRIEGLLSGSDKLENLAGELSNLRGMALHRLGDSKTGLKYLKSALSLIPESSLETRAQTEVSFCLASQQDGKKDQAIRFIDEMMNKNPAPQGVRKSRLDQVQVFLHLISGHLAQAERANQPIGALTDEQNTYGEAFREYLQGVIHLYRYEPDEALEALDYFRRTTSRRYIQFRRAAIDSMTCLAVTCQLLGRHSEVESALQLLREYVVGTGDTRLLILVDSAKARVDVLRGGPDPAIRWAETAEVSFDQTMLWFLDTPAITACRVRIEEGSADSLERAGEELRGLAELNEKHHNDIKLTEILCLSAMTCCLQGLDEAAREHLDQALKLARPGGIILPFVEWSPTLAKEMLKLMPRGQDWLSKRICQVLSQPPASDASEPALVEALTNRELDVLELLVKRLHDKEIAGELRISAETVKTHMKRIRRKLGVSSRREAAAKAHVLGLIGR